MNGAPPPQDAALAETLAERLCHDLAGLCGTLLGALDMAAEDIGGSSEAMDLARDAAGELASRLRLLRAAWGPAGEAHDAAALAALAAGLPGAARLRLDVSQLGAGVLAPDTGRLALRALLLAAEALPLGGVLSLAAPPQAAEGFTLSIAGRRAAWPDALTRPTDALDPRGLPAVLVLRLAAALGMTLSLAQGGDAASLAVAPAVPA